MNERDRRVRLERARLYVCLGVMDAGAALAAFLDEILAAGVDIVQLRDKNADTVTQARAAEFFAVASVRHDALFVVNDRADLAIAAGADGVHLGQNDLSPVSARALVGSGMLIGRSTHSPQEIERAHAEPVDYLGVGPVHATPTKPGRAGTGLGLVRVAADVARFPWFVTGGMDAATLPEALAAGLRRAVVVRAIIESAAPAEAVRAMRAILNAQED